MEHPPFETHSQINQDEIRTSLHDMLPDVRLRGMPSAFVDEEAEPLLDFFAFSDSSRKISHNDGPADSDTGDAVLALSIQKFNSSSI